MFRMEEHALRSDLIVSALIAVLDVFWLFPLNERSPTSGGRTSTNPRGAWYRATDSKKKNAYANQGSPNLGTVHNDSCKEILRNTI